MALELTNKQFSRLLTIRRAKVVGAKNAMWECRCDCGNLTIVAASNLASGQTRSCGCFQKEEAAKSLEKNGRRSTHNKTNTAEHRTWAHLKSRCYNPNDAKFPDYGARGITVCPQWKDSFESFLADMGLRPTSKHSIDRINNSGDYEPSNCRWALPIVQARNSRRNRIVEIDGQRKCISEWVEFMAVPTWKPHQMIRARGRKRDQPPKYRSIEEALAVLYWESKGGQVR